MDDSSFVAEIHCKHLGAMVLMNGSVVFDGWDERPRVSVLPLGAYLTEWSRLEVLLCKLDPAPHSPDPMFVLRLCRPGHGTGPKHMNVRLAYQWTEAEGAFEPTGLTRVVNHRFRFPRFERGPWDGAKPYSDADRPALEALFVHAQEAARSRDVPALRALLARKVTDLAPGFEQSRDDLETELLGEMAEMWAEPDFRLAPVGLDDLHLETRLEGRLVHLRDRDGRPPLRLHGGRFVLSLPLALSCIDGAWTVVR
jgi:hypothetical protein